MCQLLGMNCNVPTDICFSFSGFQARGGLTDEHRDGWGIAFFEGRGCRVFLDPLPSCNSPVAALVRNYPIHSRNVVAHIRKATQGVVALENTHPFQRELWGQYWIFAHNGNLEHFVPRLGRFLPVGSTDSEAAFCHLLAGLEACHGTAAPEPEALFDSLCALVPEIARHGSFNFLLSNGAWLIAHCSTKLSYIVRQAPFSVAHLADEDVSVDFREHTREADRVAVVATLPLTDNERWTPIEAGSAVLFVEGEALARRRCV
ncbi:MAG: class II glutamine amidotransferase [Rhodocyclaceae bacterium]|nr:class II glutamine amidotransferase [Rhodocyclaceae bacterium]